MTRLAALPPTPPTPDARAARYECVLVDYAAGALPPGPAFVVEAHLALRPDAARLVRTWEAAGGALLDAIAPVPLRAVPTDAPAPSAAGAVEPAPPAQASVLSGLDQGKWRRDFSGMLTKPLQGVNARLLKLEAGRKAPLHGHRGLELTLVLSGAFEDEDGVHRRGELLVHDEETEHAPGAPVGRDCICLVSEPGPVRLRGPMGWILDRLAR